MHRTLLLIIIFTSLLTHSIAMDGVNFSAINVSDGLSHNTVRHIMQDQKGFIWISTLNGLNRFDGNNFIVLQSQFEEKSLSENTIKKTFADNFGNIWVVSTSDIIDCYNTLSESFISYTENEISVEHSKITMTSDSSIWLYGKTKGLNQIIKKNNNLYSSELSSTSELSKKIIHFVFEDSSGNIWIGSNNGLFLFSHEKANRYSAYEEQLSFKKAIETNDFIYFVAENNYLTAFDKTKKTMQSSTKITPHTTTSSMINDAMYLKNDLALLSTSDKLQLLNLKSNEIIPCNDLFNGESIKNAHFKVDNKGNKWIYNNTGVIWFYNTHSNSFTNYKLIPSSTLSLIDLERYDILSDSRGITWISTYGNGLFGINTITNELTHLTSSNSEFKTNNLLSVSEDRDGNIWVGTEFTGVVRLSFSKERDLIFLPNNNENQENRIVRAVYEDKRKHLWIGTKSGNLYRYNEQNKLLETIHIPKGMPYCICEDNKENIWVGTKGGGLFKFYYKNNRYHITNHHINTPDAMLDNNIYAVMFDSKHRLWVGTYGEGLFMGEEINNEYKFTKFQSIRLAQHKIRCIIEDSSGNIWIGGNNGLIKINPTDFLSDESIFNHFQFNKSNPNSLSNNEVKTLHECDNTIWIGTSGSGISSLQLNKDGEPIFKHLSSKDGLINNIVQTIISDNKKNIWTSTEAGISKLNTQSFVFDNFSFSNNWASNLFSESTALLRSNGNLMFGSLDGLYIINPNEIIFDQANTPITITGFSINGNNVKPNSLNSPLTKSITETSAIELNHHQNTFSINFASLKFKDSHIDRYTYILDNFDSQWNPVTNYNIATYRNVPPGNYTFKVKSYNSSNDSNDTITTLNITITPPFWKSWQAILLYLFLFITTTYCIIRLISKMNRLNNEVKIEKQLTEYKLRFFTNISHEFRTPLTIIRASIENMRGENSASTKLKKTINTLEQSSSRLMKLIDQLLEFRKLQNNQLDLDLKYVPIQDFFFDIYSQFQEISIQKNISYTFEYNNRNINIPIDEHKIDKIVFNLLSNAFRNTPSGGQIRFRVNIDEQLAGLTFDVSDSGPGIPRDKINLLYQRFKPINDNPSGIGIGLNLTKELVNAHEGEITYSTSEWNGANFTVSIPIKMPREINIVETIPNKISTIKTTVFDDVISKDDTIKKKKYSILIIEDDYEICNFLKDQFAFVFETVQTASNGMLGLKLAQETHVDLIVCDVMMPEMNGFEVTKNLKTNFETSHIPIILLTADSSLNNKITGAEAGADSYITKPFSFKYLYYKVINLIELREKLMQKMSETSGIVRPTISTGSKDREFLEQINRIIESELSNHKFSIDDFAKTLNLSRTLLYKKTKSLTAHSPNEYIRIIRLKKAAELILSSDMNISEIAYTVGFNDPFYFSKCFKEYFKINPSHYRHEFSEINSKSE